MEFTIKCPECGSNDIVYSAETGYLVCSSCGLVIKDKEFSIDLGPEWRTFTPEQRIKRSRVGAPVTFRIHDRGMTTTIDWRDQDYSGKKLTGLGRVRALKLRRLQRKLRISGSAERKLAQMLSKINRYIACMGLPDTVTEEAARIARKVVEAKLVRGKAIDSYIAASIYAACRYQRVHRTLEEIARLVGVPKKSAAQAYRRIVRLFGDKPPLPMPKEYIPRLISSLGLPAVVQTKASEILKAAYERGLTGGKGPIGLAAAAIYCASVLLDYKRTQKEVADKANVTEVTVRNRYKEIVDNFLIIVNL